MLACVCGMDHMMIGHTAALVLSMAGMLSLSPFWRRPKNVRPPSQVEPEQRVVQK